jgi:hypothetical protein
MAAAAIATKNQIAEAISSVTPKVDQDTAHDVERHKSEAPDPQRPVRHSLRVKKFSEDEHCCRKISKIEQLFTNGVPQPLRSHGFSLRKRSSLCKRVKPTRRVRRLASVVSVSVSVLSVMQKTSSV